MRHASVFAALLGLSLTVIGTDPVTAADAATAATPSVPGAGAAAACPATTEAQKVALARAWHEEVVNRRNPAALRDILAPDMVHHAAGGRPGAGGRPATRDAGGVAAMMDDLIHAFPDLRYRPDLLIVRDDYVVERFTATGTHKGRFEDLAPSGRQATWTGINIYRIQCGRIAEVWSEVDGVSRNQQLTGTQPGR